MLAALPPEQRAALEKQHAALREEARSAGLDIPSLGAAQPAAQRAAEPAAGAEPAPAEAEAEAEAVEAAPPPSPPEPVSPWVSLADKLGVKARVEEGDSGECVFRFGAADSETGGWRLAAAPCTTALCAAVIAAAAAVHAARGCARDQPVPARPSTRLPDLPVCSQRSRRKWRQQQLHVFVRWQQELRSSSPGTRGGGAAQHRGGFRGAAAEQWR